ncbi:MAG: sensor histidine kinase [Thermoleophilaceae bacterium]
MTALILSGWAVAALAAVRCVVLRRRLHLVALAAHELRSPLTVIGLELERLSGPASPRLETQMQRVRLGLRDLDCARSGRRPPLWSGPFDVGELVARAGAGWHRAAAQAGGGLRLHWRAGRTPALLHDGRLLQALDNLVANAVEHGGPQLELVGERRDGALRVELHDSGEGFESSSPPDRRAGRGRGLEVARRAVEECGGRLDIGPGPKVAVELPLANER